MRLLRIFPLSPLSDLSQSKPGDCERENNRKTSYPIYRELDSVWEDLTPYWIEEDWMCRQIEQYDLLTVYRERINTTVYRQYCQYHDGNNLNQMLALLNRIYPEYADAAEAYMHSKEIYYMNMYIMKKSCSRNTWNGFYAFKRL
ncbi:MAG: DUF4422 domain-containing protein [Clostridium fessum]